MNRVYILHLDIEFQEEVKFEWSEMPEYRKIPKISKMFNDKYYE